MVMARSLTPTAVQGQDAGTVQSPNALPDRLRDVEHLEEVMTMPSAALIAALQELPGDIIILGVGGKIGPTLARLAKRDRKSTRLNSSHLGISYAVFCLKKKKKRKQTRRL